MTFSSDQHEDPETSAPASAAPAPQPAWARQAVEVQWEESEPLEYHQLLRGVPRPRWWKPLVGLLLGVLYYLTLSTGFTLVMFSIAAATASGPLTQQDMLVLATPDTQRPLSMVTALGSIALMIPAFLTPGPTRCRAETSSAGRRRFRD